VFESLKLSVKGKSDLESFSMKAASTEPPYFNSVTTPSRLSFSLKTSPNSL